MKNPREVLIALVRQAIKREISTVASTELLESYQIRGAFDDDTSPTMYTGFCYQSQRWITVKEDEVIS